jgi:hypothetical protein|nr:MAG TPA: DNA POLYMERASE [Caudoviricetes sp.]
MQVVFDIETSPLVDLVKNIEHIWCIALKIDNNLTKIYTCEKVDNSDGLLSEAKAILDSADVIIGHNICKFDIPIIERLLGKIKAKNLIDTLIDAKLTIPKDVLAEFDKSRGVIPASLYGSYSLKSFGFRLGLVKLDYDDFANGLNQEMMTYCKRDVDVTYKLYNELSKKERYPSKSIRECEYRVASIIFDQQEYGCYFDIDKARKESARLQMHSIGLEQKLRKQFPPMLVADGNVMIPKRDSVKKLVLPSTRPLGLFTPKYQLPIGKSGRFVKYKGILLDKPFRTIDVITTEGCAYQKLKLQVFNPSSRQQIADRLMRVYNWKPVVFTEKGNIVINAETLDSKFDSSDESDGE